MLLTLAFWRSVLRTLLVQACWNFERMQNVGFLYASLPMLRLAWKDQRKLLDAARRHSQFFNTHPYFTPIIIGAVGRLEEDWAAGQQDAERNINALKLGLMGSLGAVGDSLFWAALRPLSAWLAVIIAVLGHPLAAVIVFLLSYNLPHLIVRFGGAATGYAAGIDVVRQLKRVNFPDVAQQLKAAAVTAAFAALPLLVWRFAPQADLRASGVLFAVIVFALIRRGATGTRLAVGYLALTLVAAWLWNLLGNPQ
jgi:mannose PTS system EIID component